MSSQKNVRGSVLHTKSWNKRVVECLIARSWWMFLFILSCFMIYSHAMHQKQEVYQGLQVHYKELEGQKEALGQVHEQLLLQINSQSDPAWIELCLMKGLGVVPEGQQKVYFHGAQE